MKRITIYKLNCYEADDQKMVGESFSLFPWNEEIPGCSGEDDGGRDYLLPSGYTVDSQDGSPFIVGENGAECVLQVYNGLPLLVDHQKKQAILLEREKKLLNRREAAGLTRAQFAEMLELTQKELYELENCEKEATTRLLKRMADILGCEIMDLI